MIKKDKIILLDFLSCNDWDGNWICGVPLRYCNVGDMGHVWSESLKMVHNGDEVFGYKDGYEDYVWKDNSKIPKPHEAEEVCVIPDHDDGYKIKAYAWKKDPAYEDGVVLAKVDWTPSDEEVVAALKATYEAFKATYGDDYYYHLPWHKEEYYETDKIMQKIWKERWAEDFN